jgi:peptidoglycan-N-acetylglucosamine deacetylase
VLANEATLRRFMSDQDWHWFRFPYLREGDTSEKHRAVTAFLKTQGYKVAEVTLSFDDYAYNEPYARCLAKSDGPGIEWLQRSYLARAAEDLDRGQAAARALFGHDIPHVMLLHIGGFETVMLPRLLDLLQRRGFTLVSLPEAASDPAYEVDPTLDTIWNGTLLQQLLRARHAPPSRPVESPSDKLAESPFDKLAALCR